MKIDTSLCAERLLAADRILLLCHRDPDGDTYGSAMALFDALTGIQKQVRVICVDPFPPHLAYLNRPMPQFKEEFVVSLDVASPPMLGEPANRRSDIDLCIDHHPTNPLYAKETLLVDYAATGEAVYEVILKMGIAVSPYCATALFTSLSSDTGGFRFANTSTQTLRYAANLMECGANVDLIRYQLFESQSRGMIQVEAAAMSNIHYYGDGKIAVISISQLLMQKANILDSELDGIAAKPLQIAGVEVGITLKERADQSVRVSVRSTAKLNAAALCQRFAGGGHHRAAGCRIQGGLEKAEDQIVEASLASLEP